MTSTLQVKGRKERGWTRIEVKNLLLWLKLAREAGYNANFLAKLCGRSPRQLDRYSNKMFECSTQEWLNEQRCIDAGILLKNAHSIKEVAFELGFKQTSHFTRQFKNYYGVTPSEFMELALLTPILSVTDNKCP
jgi:AraC-like DNA-binding protein